MKRKVGVAQSRKKIFSPEVRFPFGANMVVFTNILYKLLQATDWFMCEIEIMFIHIYVLYKYDNKI